MTLQRDPEPYETKYLHTFADFVGKQVLEIGCGDGRITWQYAKSASRSTGIDLDGESLRIAAMDRTPDLQGKASFAHADSVHLPFPRETFDIVVLAWSL